LLFVLCWNLAVSGQESLAAGKLPLQGDADDAAFPVEKVYLHFDRSHYQFGDSCWFKAYVVTGPGHQPSNVSGVLYVDWLDRHFNLIEQQKLHVTNGQAEGNFTFSRHVSSGIYIARAYTRWMRNQDAAFFFKRLFNVSEDSPSVSAQPMNMPKNATHVDFFPEGGSLVEGVETRMAVRVSNENGEGADIAGDIIDERGTTINRLETTYGGMAVFPYVPGKGKYSLRLSSGKTFALPAARKTGVVMNVNNSGSENIFVAINATVNNVNRAFTLIGVTANEICYRSNLMLNSTHGEFMISKAALPSGVIQLTLLDNSGSRVCERMIFINNINSNYIELQQNIRGDSLFLDIQQDYAGTHPAFLAMSVAVGFDSSHPKTNRNNNIFAYLLLMSESKIPIEIPAEIIGSPSARNTFIVDLVMLTHDFRKTDLTHTVGNSSFRAEAGLTLRGRAKLANSKKTVGEGVITLVIDDRDYKGIYTAEIDTQGNFRIQDIDYGDSTLLVWQYQDKKGKIRPIDVELYDSIDVPPADTTLKLLVARCLAERKANNFDTDAGDDRYELLEKVVVKGVEKKVRAVGAGSILVTPGKDDLNLPASQFVSAYAIGLPFLKPVTFGDGSMIWVTTSGAGVRLLIDGFDVDEHKTGVNPYHYLMMYRTDEIENVMISGSNYTGYTIRVKINKNASRGPRNFVQRYARGYKRADEFHGNQLLTAAGTSAGTTMYWNPHLTTDDSGSAKVASCIIGSKPISVILQGIGMNGEIIDHTLLISPN
jgi:hypothetical protein